MSQVMRSDSGVAFQLFAHITWEVVQPLLPIAPALAIVFPSTECQVASRDALVHTLGNWSTSAAQTSSSWGSEELSEESSSGRRIHAAFFGVVQELSSLLRGAAITT
jgi:hypothetical protein